MDLAAPPGSDLAMTLPPDMQPAYGCHDLLACIASCTSNSCITACNQSATAHARMLDQAIRRCIRNECYPVPDAGAAPCTFGGGTPTPACTMCQADSIKTSGSCGSDTTYCGTCYTEYAACEADLP